MLNRGIASWFRLNSDEPNNGKRSSNETIKFFTLCCFEHHTEVLAEPKKLFAAFKSAKNTSNRQNDHQAMQRERFKVQ